MNATQYFKDQTTNNKEITINGTGISLTKNLLTTPVTAYLTQEGVQVGVNSSTWQNLSLLDDVLASVEYPPNPQTLKLNNTLLLDSNLGSTNKLDIGGMVITDASLAPTTNLTVEVNGVYCDYPTINRQANYTNTGLYIGDTSNASQLNADCNQLVILDNAGVMKSQLTADALAMIDNNAGTITQYGNSSILSNGIKQFELINSNNFFKQYQPTSWFPEYYNNGQKIEPYSTFICVENGNAPEFYNYGVYLDSNGNEGWSCFISNFYDADITIYNPDGIKMYSSTSGASGGSIALKKWATARFTLVKLPSFGDYTWAVSQF
jgi:hypothetical protein